MAAFSSAGFSVLTKSIRCSLQPYAGLRKITVCPLQLPQCIVFNNDDPSQDVFLTQFANPAKESR